MRKTATLLIVCIFAFMSAEAFPRDISVKPFCDGLLKDAEHIVRMKDEASQKASLDRIISDKFASALFLKEALWKYWTAIDEGRRYRIESLFPKTLTKSIMQRLKKAGPQDIDSFKLVSTENLLNGKLARYKGQVDDQSVAFDVLLTDVNGTLKITNVIIENADMRQNYEGQFSRIIDKYGIDELIRRLEDKAGE